MNKLILTLCAALALVLTTRAAAAEKPLKTKALDAAGPKASRIQPMKSKAAVMEQIPVQPTPMSKMKGRKPRMKAPADKTFSVEDDESRIDSEDLDEMSEEEILKLLEAAMEAEEAEKAGKKDKRSRKARAIEDAAQPKTGALIKTAGQGSTTAPKEERKLHQFDAGEEFIHHKRGGRYIEPTANNQGKSGPADTPPPPNPGTTSGSSSGAGNTGITLKE